VKLGEAGVGGARCHLFFLFQLIVAVSISSLISSPADHYERKRLISNDALAGMSEQRAGEDTYTVDHQDLLIIDNIIKCFDEQHQIQQLLQSVPTGVFDSQARVASRFNQVKFEGTIDTRYKTFNGFDGGTPRFECLLAIRINHALCFQYYNHTKKIPKYNHGSGGWVALNNEIALKRMVFLNLLCDRLGHDHTISLHCNQALDGIEIRVYNENRTCVLLFTFQAGVLEGMRDWEWYEWDRDVAY
jgi:hypothetical protein